MPVDLASADSDVFKDATVGNFDFDAELDLGRKLVLPQGVTSTGEAARGGLRRLASKFHARRDARAEVRVGTMSDKWSGSGRLQTEAKKLTL